MLMKIGDVTNKFGISHRSLHYWESVGILKSSRAENDYRYYNEENLLKIKQIVLLRKLKLPIPSIQEIFSSNELSKVIAVFTDHLVETKREAEQLNALGTILRQLLNMLRDRQSLESVYTYLDTNHSTESEEIKAALKTVLSEPVLEIAVKTATETIVDMAGIDLTLEKMKAEDIDVVMEAVKRCFANTGDICGLLKFFDFERQLNMPGCAYWYKIIQGGELFGAVNLAFTGMESMLIRNVAYPEPDNNIFIFERLKQNHPDVLCWMMFDAGEDINQYSYPDIEMKKQQFREDNGFTFYTDANRRSQYVKMMKPHDEVYNSSRYRFALLDNSMDNTSFRMCALHGVDWYDNYMGNWSITDSAFMNAQIYANTLERSKFYKNYMADCDFRYCDLERSQFTDVSFKNCALNVCDLTGMTIDGINVEKALKAYKNANGENAE